MSKAEEELALQLKAYKIPFEREIRFAYEAIGSPKKGIRNELKEAGLKDWRFDFFIRDIDLAIEVEGITSYGKNKNGTMRLGRHQTAKGMEQDLLKYSEAMKLGWKVYRCSPSMIKNGKAIDAIRFFYMCREV